jgi:hypothetical protein
MFTDILILIAWLAMLLTFAAGILIYVGLMLAAAYSIMGRAHD